MRIRVERKDSAVRIVGRQVSVQLYRRPDGAATCTAWATTRRMSPPRM